MDSNHYYETPKGIQGEMTDDVISARMSECQMVITELTKSKVWDILLKDARDMIKMIDGSWQDLPENDPKIREMRVLKMASKHIFDLPIKYAQEMDMLSAELQKRQKPEENIQKDFDKE